MADEKRDRNYDIRSLNRWFAVGSVLLLVTVIAMVADDYSRQWKGFQRSFFSTEAARTRKAIQEAEKALNSSEMKKLQASLKEAEEETRKRQEELESAESRLESISADIYGKDMAFRFAKANYDSRKYEVEFEIDELRKHNRLERAAAKQAELEALRKKMIDAQLELEAATAEEAKARAEVAAIAGKLTEIRTGIARMTAERDRLRKRLQSVSPGFVNWLLNAPMLDFMAPTLQVQQVVLPKLRHDINFMEVPRVDRCMTCHTAIDRPGYEDAPQPFRSHPFLDLFVEEKSSHPLESFGCTACHWGRDRGTSFTSAAHMPDSEAQKKEWQEKYGWEEMHYWETPMRSRSYFYAGCYVCHSEQVIIPRAGPQDPNSTIGNLDHGLRIVEVSGCYGCHEIKGFENRRKAGPALTRIASKTDSDWATRWIFDPRSFRPTTRMPSFFRQSNQQDSATEDRPSARDLNLAEVEGIVAYLWARSDPIRYAKVTGEGNRERGRDLVRRIGCYGCHTDDPAEVLPVRAHPRAFGPNLHGMGSKVTREWLFNWLKNPKHYWEDTGMPGMRLSDQEALDVTSYLLSLRNPDFDKLELPPVQASTRDWLVLEYLGSRMSRAAAAAQMAGMTEEDKKLYLGEKMINKYGCFACHDIKGFENARPIGTELTEEGSKPVDRLDFGLEEGTVDKNMQSWLAAKMRNPRIFDRGKIKTWDEKLKMPNFHFNDQEIRDLVTAILGFAKARMDADMRWNLTVNRGLIEEGRRVIRDHNCIGCHSIGDEVGAIRAVIEDPGYHPPPLNGEGEKVIPVWLFNFLRSPSTIRPWLEVRMPSFGLEDHETVLISRTFAALDNAEYPFESNYFELEPVSPEVRAGGAKLFTDFKCLQCHIAGTGRPQRDAADLAPNLSLARARLRPLWIDKWLRDPQKLQPGTRMPGYFPDMQTPDRVTLGGDAALQIKALRSHVLSLAPRGASVATDND